MGKEKSRQFAGFVWMKGLEPSTSWSLTRCATNCATSRIWDCKVSKIFDTPNINGKNFESGNKAY